ncbi:hypothetical protein [Pseudomonas sp. PGPR40]|uniref:hypothetical protein n=1 Tax=Pseudomonas sp. PGPR40 TaxID=2913476 RepID=UPI001EDBE364|nr:hypothetical protein [Pseudomonas sp. PGPR40]
MGNALDGRPLLVRLQKRIEKYTGCLAGPLATDVTLHQQSVDLINEWALKQTRENLRACQATIHLCGGFDPAYVNDALAAMKNADAALAKATQ